MKPDKRCWMAILIIGIIMMVASVGYAGVDFAELTSGVRADRIRSTVETLSNVDSRIVGYPGHTLAAQFVSDQFREIGLQDVQTEDYTVSVPMDKGGHLQVLEANGVREDGRQSLALPRMPIFGMWPNLVRTPSLPLEGIQGALIYGKKGWYSDFNGMDVEGRIVLMDFNSSNNWLNPAMLGAKAIVFIEPDSTVYMEAEDKFLTVPLSIPRFWIGKEDGHTLLDLLQRGSVQVEMKARMIWERVPAMNILGWIPGTDPVLKDDIIVLESYYDGMSVVPALAPSAEMSSGITALLELARFFRANPPSRTLLFLATTGHHFGLRGIGDFLVRHDRKEDPFIERMTKSFNAYDERTGEEKTEEGPRIKLFIGLDLSTKTDELGVWNSSTDFYFKRYFAPFGRKFMAISREMSKALGRDPKHTLANGISPEAGMSWQTYVPGEISVDSELVLATGTPALSFVTINDARFAVDTPLDTPSKVNYENLTRQVRFLAGLFYAAFDDPEFFPDFKMRLKDNLMTLEGNIMTFPRRSIVPDRPRKGAVAVLHNGKKKSYKGVRGEFYEVVDDKGRFEISRIRVRSVELEAFYMDPYSGTITYAPDRGVQGDKSYPMRFSMDWRHKKWMIVLFPCIGTDFYDIVDPRYLTKLTTINVFDETNSSPVEFGYSIGMQAVGNEATRPVGVVFTRPETKVKIAMGSGLIGFRFLLLNSANAVGTEAAKGAGYKIDAPGSFVQTSFSAAQDMWALDEARMEELRKYGIENFRLTQLHGQAKEQIAKAEEAKARKQWDAFVKHTRSALGVESRAYPDVKATQNDVIRGIIFFMALVIPFAYFGERLLFTFPQITKQIAGFAGIFLAIWLVLWWVHPAFQLSNPAVILLAFIILALAVLVMLLITSKFGHQMRSLRTETAVVHETDVGRISASYAAFSLGISNMKRRKVRTALTFVTLLLLTFTVLSFTSVKSTLEFNQISRDNEGLYEGALIRSKSWNPLEESAYEYAQSNFQEIATVAPRNWYISRAKNYIKVKAEGGKSANALGVVGMTPQETQVTGLDRCLIAGRWFREEDRRVCILPNDMLANTLLDIDLAEVGEAQVRLFGEMFTVIGVADPKKMKTLEDLDDEILTPADFQLTGGQAVQEMAEEEQRQKQGLENPKVVIKPFVHLEPANVLIVPYQTLRDVGGALQSVAIRFEEGEDVLRHVKEFITRLAVTLFAGIQEEGEESIKVSVYSSYGRTLPLGLSNLFIPIMIAALIVLNTMMGSVYERFTEIGIYSSVGLAPVHIAFLFMAESCVYAVLGTVAGYLAGQIIAKVLIVFDVLQGITLNYSSMSAVTSSMLVMAVVMLSTIYPARKASQMAVPDVTRKWKLPEPDGDRWVFDFPFTVGGEDVFGLCVFLIGYFDSYSEESIGIFYTHGATLRAFDTEHGEGYSIDIDVWLAPFDLGVSQHVLFRAIPTGDHNVYSIELTIHRLSGEDASWRRVNQRFMNAIRKQFLIWRTVSPEAKEEYREEGRGMLEAQRKQVA